jgi:hypothetical protein
MRKAQTAGLSEDLTEEMFSDNTLEELFMGASEQQD